VGACLLGLRIQACRDAGRDQQAEGGGVMGFPHGTENGYANLGCRCDPCKSARSEAQRERRARRPKPPRPTRDELFWAKVKKTDSCWLWTGATTSSGYGNFKVDSGWDTAHRYSWRTLIAPIPGELTIDHLCANKLCVNPWHMQVVTRSENSRRANRARRLAHA
jgi:hypothetical protein